MARFLIEVPHKAERIACYRAIGVFLTTGPDFLANCDWGCRDGVHKAWITVDAESSEEALRAVPAAFRPQATVVQVGRFSLDDVEKALLLHT